MIYDHIDNDDDDDGDDENDLRRNDDENDQRKNDECLTLTNAKADLLHVPTLLPPLLYKPAAPYFTFYISHAVATAIIFS